MIRMVRTRMTTTSASNTSATIRPGSIVPSPPCCVVPGASFVRPDDGGGAADLHYLHGRADRQHLQRVVRLGGPLLAGQLHPAAVLVHRADDHRVAALERLD